MDKENELMIDCNGYIYFETTKRNVNDACRKLMEAFESVGINVDNVEFMNAELRNGEGDMIDKSIKYEHNIGRKKRTPPLRLQSRLRCVV